MEDDGCGEETPKEGRQMSKKLPDSGKRIGYGTGAIREPAQGKGRFDLIPPEPIAALARHSALAIIKYPVRNWEKGIPLSRFTDSALRHMNQFMEGKADEDHLIAALWNIMALWTTRHRIQKGLLPKRLNDMPPKLYRHLRR